MSTKVAAKKPVIRSDAIAWDRQISAVLSVWRRNFHAFKKSWKTSTFWILCEPILILFAVGYGVGIFISNIEGLSYVEFFLPGLVCNAAMLVAFFVATYDNYVKLHTQKLYSTQVMTPIEPREVFLGEVLWVATKGFMSATGVFLVASAIGIVEPANVPWALASVFVSALFFAAFGMLLTSTVKSSDQFIFPMSGLIIPMSLFCGTYFPLSQYPVWFKYVMYIFPQTHAVEATRIALVRGWNWTMLGHLAFVFVLLIIVVRIATPRFHSKLIN